MLLQSASSKRLLYRNTVLVCLYALTVSLVHCVKENNQSIGSPLFSLNIHYSNIFRRRETLSTVSQFIFSLIDDMIRTHCYPHICNQDNDGGYFKGENCFLDISLLRNGSCIYVPAIMLSIFIENNLDKIKVPVTIVSDRLLDQSGVCISFSIKYNYLSNRCTRCF